MSCSVVHSYLDSLRHTAELTELDRIDMPKYLILLLPVIAVALANGLDTSGRWVEIRSPHFTVITDSNEKQGRQIAAQVERMRGFLQEAYPQLETDPDYTVVILAIRDKKEFRALEPKTYLDKGSLTLHGMYLGVSEKNYILMRLDAEGGNPYPIVYHEYTHLVLNGLRSPLPLWLSEGLAQFYEPTEIYDKEVMFGKVLTQHLLLLRQAQLLPLPTLFTIDDKSPYYLEKKKGSIFYAESWALTHYLTQRDFAERTSKIQQYMKLLSENADAITDAIRAFGDLGKLQKALEAYIQKPSSNHFKTTLLAPVDDLDFESLSITPAQVQNIEADFLANSGRVEEAQVLVDDLLRRDPNEPSAKQTEMLLRLAKEQKAETELRSALESNPSSAAACDQLALFLWKRGKKLEEANALESKAVYLDPAKLEYRINLANVLLAMGRSQAALDVLRKAVAVARTPDETARIELLLHDADEYVSVQNRQPNAHQLESTTSVRPTSDSVSDDGHEFTPAGPHRFVVGFLKSVRCDSPNLDLTVTSESKTVSLHAENFYKVKFTALFPVTNDLDPCTDLENKRAKVEYVESVDRSETPRLIAVELHK